MRLLAIETATEACSVALMLDDRVVERHTREPRAHAERVLKMIEDCLDEAGTSLDGLDALAFGRGPGSFTGVRIATGVVQGLALGTGLPVVPVSTLAGYAVAAWRESRGEATQVAVAVDARMGECYWGCYLVSDDGVAAPVGEEVVVSPEDVPAPEEGAWRGIGSGWEAFPGLVSSMPWVRVGPAAVLPTARDLLATGMHRFAGGKAVPAERALPVYLREKVAWRDGPSRN